MHTWISSKCIVKWWRPEKLIQFRNSHDIYPTKIVHVPNLSNKNDRIIRKTYNKLWLEGFLLHFRIIHAWILASQEIPVRFSIFEKIGVIVLGTAKICPLSIIFVWKMQNRSSNVDRIAYVLGAGKYLWKKSYNVYWSLFPSIYPCYEKKLYPDHS